MKKQRQTFETMFWAVYEIKNAIKVLEAVFTYASLVHYKQIVNDTILYSQKEQVYDKLEPCELFRCHAILRSFFRACAIVESNSNKKNIFKFHTPCKSILHQASLSDEEYHNPFQVFKNALTENSVEEYESFFALMVEMGLSRHQLNDHFDWFNYYLHTVKMLDAAQLLKERGIQKNKIKKQTVEAAAQEPQVNINASLVSGINSISETTMSEPLIGEEKEQFQKSITEVITATLHTYGIFCFWEKQMEETIAGVYSQTKQFKTTHYYI